MADRISLWRFVDNDNVSGHRLRRAWGRAWQLWFELRTGSVTDLLAPLFVRGAGFFVAAPSA